MIDKKVKELSLEEKQEIMEYAKQLGYKPKKRKMQTSKKFLWIFVMWALFIQTYVMVMIVALRDTMSLSIITGVVFIEAVGAYFGYLKYNYGINIKAMEENFDPNYDDNHGVM